MIVETICNILFGVIYFVVGLFPALPSFDSLNVDLSPLLYVLGFVNNFVSSKVVGSCLVIVLLVYNAKFILSMLMWLVRKIPMGVS